MLDIMLAGVGGQGTVLAAKVLAQAAQDKGWHVRTAETIGMAQRGGSVVSHVRMGNDGEVVHAPLIAKGTADMIIAFEPAEGARVLPYLASEGVLVTVQTALQPVTAALSKNPYRASDVLEGLRDQLGRREGTPAAAEAASGHSNPALIVVPDDALIDGPGGVGNRKALNTVLLACALSTGRIPLGIDDLKAAIAACVKPRFVDMNLAAIDTALAMLPALQSDMR